MLATGRRTVSSSKKARAELLSVRCSSRTCTETAGSVKRPFSRSRSSPSMPQLKMPGSSTIDCREVWILFVGRHGHPKWNDRQDGAESLRNGRRIGEDNWSETALRAVGRASIAGRISDSNGRARPTRTISARLPPSDPCRPPPARCSPACQASWPIETCRQTAQEGRGSRCPCRARPSGRQERPLAVGSFPTKTRNLCSEVS